MTGGGLTVKNPPGIGMFPFDEPPLLLEPDWLVGNPAKSSGKMIGGRIVKV